MPVSRGASSASRSWRLSRLGRRGSGRAHRSNTAQCARRDALMEEVGHRVHEDQLGPAPAKGDLEPIRPDLEVEALAEGVARDAAATLGERLRVAVGAPWRDLVAPCDGFQLADVHSIRLRSLIRMYVRLRGGCTFPAVALRSRGPSRGDPARWPGCGLQAHFTVGGPGEYWTPVWKPVVVGPVEEPRQQPVQRGSANCSKGWQRSRHRTVSSSTSRIVFSFRASPHAQPTKTGDVGRDGIPQDNVRTPAVHPSHAAH